MAFTAALRPILSSNRLGLSTLLWLVLIVVLKHDVLFAPPVWDTAMGVFPPAIHLYQNNFDIFSLIQEETWWQGGPNVHSLSLVTWVIAMVMKITGDPHSTFATLHFLTFLATAYGMAVYVRLLTGFGLSTLVSVASGLFVLVFPVTLVQVGYMYTEVPVMVCFIVSVDLWRRGRINGAIALCCIALFIKLTAVALALSMVLTLVLFPGKPVRTNVIQITALLVAALVSRYLPLWMGRPAIPDAGWGSPSLLMQQLQARMNAVPDLAWIMGIAVVIALILLVMELLKQNLGKGEPMSDRESQARVICILVPVMFTLAIVAGVYSKSLLLPRYLVPALPFAVAVLLLFLELAALRRTQLVLLVAGTLFSVSNTNGRYYPPNLDSFSVVERSHAYQSFNAVKVQAIGALLKKPAALPAYVTREIGYMVSDPMMGYVDTEPSNVYPVYIDPHIFRPLNEFPDHFLLVRASVIHGGRKIGKLVDEAKNNADYEVTEQHFEIDGFKAAAYEIQRKQD